MDLYSLAEKYYIDERYAEAYNLFEKSLDNDQKWDCFNYMGCCQLKLKNYCQAIELFNNAIKLNREWERPFFNKGRVYMELGNFVEALKCFEEALEINPNNEDLYFYLGIYHYKRQNYGDAIKYYNKSLEINSNQSEVYLNLGMSYFQIEEFDKAIQSFEKASEDEYILVDALINKALIYIELKEYNKALKILMSVHKLHQEDEEIMNHIAYVLYKLNKFDQSLIWIKRILDINCNNNDAKELKKFIYRQVRELKK